jgi:2-haloacid dehalogenase
MSDVPRVRVLLFDVFGTLVDWRTSVAERIADVLGPDVDGGALADAWRARYRPAMDAVRSGARPYAPLDVLHRENLDAVLAEMGLADRVGEGDRRRLNRAWHTLRAWPEVPAALVRLRRDHLVAPCSNGDVDMLVSIARTNGLIWDAVLGAGFVGEYKPSPAVYLRSAGALGCRPEEVMMVAAHSWDLEVASGLGMRTGFVARPDEHGPGRGEREPSLPVDVAAADLAELADALGAA